VVSEIDLQIGSADRSGQNESQLHRALMIWHREKGNEEKASGSGLSLVRLKMGKNIL
jgi:hypothetical protein